MQTYIENLGGSANYNIYVPENVNEDTPVLFYSFNLGVTKKMKEDILGQNGDAIIIVPENSPVIVGDENNFHQYQSEAIEVFNLVKEKYNLETEQFSQAGFSSAYGCSIRTMADYLKSNPDAERQVLISVDGCESDTPNGFTIYDSEYAALKENNTIIISYSQKYRQSSEIRFLKDAGLPILFVVDPDIPENSYSSWGHYHDVVANNFLDRGLYNSLLNFALGNGDLPEGYIYQIYNPQTGQIEDISAESATTYLGIESSKITLHKLSSLSDLVLASDDKVLESYLNNIIGKIRNTTFISENYSGEASFVSTTNIPTQIPVICSSFFAGTANLLTKIANETVEFAKIAASINNLDLQMMQASDILGDEIVDLDTGATSIDTTNNTTLNSGTDSSTVIEEVITNETEGNSSESTVQSSNSLTGIVGGSVGGAIVGTIAGSKDTDTSKEEVEEQKPNSNTQNSTNVSNQSPNNNNQTSNENNSETSDKTQGTQNDTVNKPSGIDDFPKYEDLYSDDTKIVYNCNDEYKMVVHRDGDKVTGIEHYYDFGTREDANAAIENLQAEYSTNENFDTIVQNDRYVKVLFKEDMYKNINLTDIKNQYSEYNEVIKL